MSRIGLRRRGNLREDLPLAAEVNLTSLVDVAFTLLVIFIITAPILQGGVEVTLPQANVRPVTSVEDILVVTVQRDGTVFVEETAWTIEEFEAGIGQILRAAGTLAVYVRGDEQAPYGIPLRVAAAVANAEVGVSLIAEPRPVAR